MWERNLCSRWPLKALWQKKKLELNNFSFCPCYQLYSIIKHRNKGFFIILLRCIVQCFQHFSIIIISFIEIINILASQIFQRCLLRKRVRKDTQVNALFLSSYSLWYILLESLINWWLTPSSAYPCCVMFHRLQ